MVNVEGSVVPEKKADVLILIVFLLIKDKK
jgi:hypothetical protein